MINHAGTGLAALSATANRSGGMPRLLEQEQPPVFTAMSLLTTFAVEAIIVMAPSLS